MSEIRDYIINNKILDDDMEINKFDTFFSNPELIEELNKVEKNRIKRYIWLSLCIVIFLLGLYFWFWIIGIIPIFYVLYIYYKKIDLNIKEKILTKLSKEIDSNLEYDYWKKYAFWELNKLRELNFINSYDSIKKIEDSIWFYLQQNWKYAVIQWYELRTTKTSWSWKNRRTVETNHCYLLKIKIPSARIKIEKDIYIKSDSADNKWTTIFISIFLWIIAWLVAYAYFQNLTNWIISFLLIILLSYTFINKYNNSNRIKLENIEFEKIYDVICEDQISSRMIITPAFMDRLVNLSKKTKRKYEFILQNNTIYIKWKLESSYLEINTWKKITTNIKWFIDWYIEMKEILLFVKEMQILYLSKTEQIYTNTIETKPEYEIMNDEDIIWNTLNLWNLWNIKLNIWWQLWNFLSKK